MKSSTNPRVSIIMRSKNSDWVIDRALAALFSQTFTDFDLTVVDSGSTDRTLKIVRSYPCNVIEIDPGNYFPGAVLNSSIKQTSGEIIIFQNSDSVPLTQHSLTHLVKPFDDAKVQAVFGRQVPRPEADDWVRRDYDASFPATTPAPTWLTLSLPFAGLRRTAWQAHPFYEDAWASEDTEWGNWALQNGYHVEYAPDALVMHSHNYTFEQIFGRRFVEGEADAFIYGGGDSWKGMVSRTVTSTLRDMQHQISCGHLRDLLRVPIRRMVYQWAYYRGRNFGKRRSVRNDSDVVTGQRAVLSRYQ